MICGSEILVVAKRTRGASETLVSGAFLFTACYLCVCCTKSVWVWPKPPPLPALRQSLSDDKVLSPTLNSRPLFLRKEPLHQRGQLCFEEGIECCSVLAAY